MRDQRNVVHCMVSEYALRHRALADSVDEEGVGTLFRLYRGEVEALASQQYESGSMDPIARAFDLAAPPAP